MPRLDVTFKKGPVPKERGEISSLRMYWKQFCLTLSEMYSDINANSRVIEIPLWQITPDLVSNISVNADRIYIPHKMALNWPFDSRVNYYMQMVIPSLFSIDTVGWCASSSDWPIPFDRWEESIDKPDIFDVLSKRIMTNTSKFIQPSTEYEELPEKYILFPCQLPHDETIRYHSDVSVEKSLQALLESLKLNHGCSIVIKGHPANSQAMMSLKNIYNVYKKELPPEYASKIYWIDEISIHQAISQCKAVFTVNSGVGFEAILHLKPVYTFGNADYASASKKIMFGGNVLSAAHFISQELGNLADMQSSFHTNKCRSFINSWYYTHYDCNNKATFRKAAK